MGISIRGMAIGALTELKEKRVLAAEEERTKRLEDRKFKMQQKLQTQRDDAAALRNEYTVNARLQVARENAEAKKAEKDREALVAENKNKTLFDLPKSMYAKHIPQRLWGNLELYGKEQEKNRVTKKLESYNAWLPYVLRSRDKGLLNHFLQTVSGAARGSDLMHPKQREAEQAWVYNWKKMIPNIYKFATDPAFAGLIDPSIKQELMDAFNFNLPKSKNIFGKRVRKEVVIIPEASVTMEIEDIQKQQRVMQYNKTISDIANNIRYTPPNTISDVTIGANTTIAPFVNDLKSKTNNEAVIYLSGEEESPDLSLEYRKAIEQKAIPQIRTAFGLDREQRTVRRLDIISDSVIALNRKYVLPHDRTSGGWTQQKTFTDEQETRSLEEFEKAAAAGMVLRSTDKLQELVVKMFEGEKLSQIQGLQQAQVTITGLIGKIPDMSKVFGLIGFGDKLSKWAGGVSEDTEGHALLKDNSFDLETQNGLKSIIEASRKSLEKARGTMDEETYNAAVQYNFEKIKLVYQVAKLIQGGAGGQAVSNMDFGAIKDSFSAGPFGNIRGQIAIFKHLAEVTSDRYIMHKIYSNKFLSNTDRNRLFHTASKVAHNVEGTTENRKKIKTIFQQKGPQESITQDDREKMLAEWLKIK